MARSKIFILSLLCIAAQFIGANALFAQNANKAEGLFQAANYTEAQKEYGLLLKAILPLHYTSIATRAARKNWATIGLLYSTSRKQVIVTTSSTTTSERFTSTWVIQTKP